jgi:CubicO group peptidase (beta-lactamase class C family)
MSRRLFCVLPIRYLLVIVYALLCAPELLLAQIASSAGSLLISKVDALMAPYLQMRAFRGTVLIAEGKSVVLSRGYGMPSSGENSALSNAKYLIGSLSKTLTDAAIELLAERHLLNLDDSVSKFLPNVVYARNVTIRQLLDHSAGVPDYYGFPEYAEHRQADISFDEILRIIGSKPLEFPAGSKSSYSNSGYSLLAAIVQGVTRMQVGEFLTQHVFRPLGMGSSGDYDYDPRTQGLVAGFDPGPLPSLLRPAPRGGTGWLEGNGSVFSTAGDLLRWADAVHTDALARTSSLPYPYGWGKRTRYGREFWEDVGRIPQGYASFIAIEPHGKLTVIVLSDVQSQAVESIGIALEAIALDQPYNAPSVAPFIFLDSISGSRFAGRYEVFPGFVIAVRATTSGLELGGPDGAFLTLDYQGANKFFFRPYFVPIGFRTDDSGRVVTLLWAGTQECKRLN